MNHQPNCPASMNNDILFGRTCTCPPTEKKIEGWEEEFDKIAPGLQYNNWDSNTHALLTHATPDKIKSFISALLLSSQEAAREGETESEIKGERNRLIAMAREEGRKEERERTLEIIRKERDTWARESIGDKALQSLLAALSETKK